MDNTELLAVHPDPVLQYESTGDSPVVRRVNPAFERTFGPTDDTVALGETVASTDALAVIRDAIETGEQLDRTTDCRTADGVRPFRLRHVPAAAGGYLLYTDQTERIARERELQDRNDHLEAFASVVSHDLRNPIDVAETYLASARAEDDSEKLQHIDDALDRMRTLINDVLGLARQRQVLDETERVVLASVASDAVAVVDIDGPVEIDTESATVRTDPARLQQLLENLLRNASEHGGSTVRIGLLDADGWYLEDDGPGIPPDERPDVFEPGVTTAHEGTGLGLAIVERIATAHDWSVAVTESPEGGARFEFTGVDSLQPF